MKYKNIIFAMSAIVILCIAAYFLFGKDVPTANAQKDARVSSGTFSIDGVFTIEDIAEFSPLPSHKDYLSIEQYASYCRELQSSGRYSKNVHVNAILSTKAYIALEEIPVYESFLKDLPADAVANQIHINVTMVPEEMHLRIVAACK